MCDSNDLVTPRSECHYFILYIKPEVLLP